MKFPEKYVIISYPNSNPPQIVVIPYKPIITITGKTYEECKEKFDK